MKLEELSVLLKIYLKEDFSNLEKLDLLDEMAEAGYICYDYDKWILKGEGKKIIREIQMLKSFQKEYLEEMYEKLRKPEQEKFDRIFKMFRDDSQKIKEMIKLIERALRKDGRL